MPFPTASAPCAACGAALWAEARFCHRCGAPVGGEAAPPGRAATVEEPPPRAPESRLVTVLPWLVAVVAVGALVALLVGQRLGLGRTEPPMPPALESAGAPTR